jgi:hypothetical protein
LRSPFRLRISRQPANVRPPGVKKITSISFRVAIEGEDEHQDSSGRHANHRNGASDELEAEFPDSISNQKALDRTDQHGNNPKQ